MIHPLTILLPTHGRPSLLGRTLESVAACARPAGYAGCVVVENGPRAGAESVVAEAARSHAEAGFRYLHVERANKSAALNAALAPLDGLAVFLDDDVRLDPGVLTAYAEAAARHPDRAYFGGPTASDFEARPPEWQLPFFPRSVRGSHIVDGRLEEVLGFNWAAYASDLREAGGFDPLYGPGSPTGARGQESEMHRRLDAAGLRRVAVPDAVVWHYVPADRSSMGWLRRRKFQVGTSMAQSARQGGGDPGVSTSIRAVVRASGSLVKQTLAGNPEGRCRAVLDVWTHAGALYGHVRMFQRRTPTVPA